jgi:Family of unknown function (DUF5340)
MLGCLLKERLRQHSSTQPTLKDLSVNQTIHSLKPNHYNHQRSSADRLPPPHMDQIKLPSLVHYELILQVLERQTMIAADRDPIVRERVQQLIVTLRKALSQHKLLEDTCRNQQISIEHVWALNSVVGDVATRE